jgi:hypothetical protein
LVELRSGTPDEIVRFNRNRKQEELVKRPAPGTGDKFEYAMRLWESALKEAIALAGMRIKWLDHAIPELKQLISGWKPKPLGSRMDPVPDFFKG